MSNEYKDYVNNLREIFNEKMDEVDFLYDGWDNTFVPNMMDEMFNVLGPYVEDFEVYQVKEKYGALEMYYGWQDREYTEEEFKDINDIVAEIDSIINKYRHISSRTCVHCGNKATILSSGWVLPFCDECYDRDCGIFGIIED
jgi:hypothetical protein